MPGDETPTSAPEPEFSRLVTASKIPADGQTIDLIPDTDTLALIAKRFAIPAIAAVKGTLTLVPTAHGVQICGRFTAALTRECVASLEPLAEHIDETVDVTFDRRVTDGDEDAIMDQLADGQDAEPLRGDDIDVGEFLVQQLSLAMDPFPRKPGAPSLVERYGAAPEPSAFDALKALKPVNDDG
ncbi:MAG: YceD family protein [Pseudomonadota bacterium]